MKATVKGLLYLNIPVSSTLLIGVVLVSNASENKALTSGRDYQWSQTQSIEKSGSETFLVKPLMCREMVQSRRPKLKGGKSTFNTQPARKTKNIICSKMPWNKAIKHKLSPHGSQWPGYIALRHPCCWWAGLPSACLSRRCVMIIGPRGDPGGTP